MLYSILLSLLSFAPQESLHERIVSFCKENLGKAVGDGDCYDLGKYALHAAGAKPSFKYPQSPNKGDYVWGQQVLLLEGAENGAKATGKAQDIRPGHVIQFRDTKWESKKANGKGTWTQGFSHHTAIVSAIENEGKLIKFYHQNFKGKRLVMEGSIILADLKSGWIRVYRPVPK